MWLAGEPVFLALCASFFFGLALVLTQFGLRYMRPAEGVLISIPLLTVLAWAIAFVHLDFSGWNREAAAIFLAVGLAYPALVTMLTYESNRLMGPGVAGALGNLAPLFAVTGAAIVFADWPGPSQIAGIIAIVAGIALVSLRGGEAAGRQWPWWTVALPLGASVIRGIAQPVTKIGLASWPSPFTAVLFGFTASTLVVAGVALVRNAGLPRGFSRPGMLWFCCVGISNGLAVLTLYAALAQGSVVLVAPLAATYPLATLALSALLLRSERITTVLAVAVAVTVFGVGLLFGS